MAHWLMYPKWWLDRPGPLAQRDETQAPGRAKALGCPGLRRRARPSPPPPPGSARGRQPPLWVHEPAHFHGFRVPQGSMTTAPKIPGGIRRGARQDPPIPHEGLPIAGEKKTTTLVSGPSSDAISLLET